MIGIRESMDKENAFFFVAHSFNLQSETTGGLGLRNGLDETKQLFPVGDVGLVELAVRSLRFQLVTICNRLVSFSSSSSSSSFFLSDGFGTFQQFRGFSSSVKKKKNGHGIGIGEFSLATGVRLP